MDKETKEKIKKAEENGVNVFMTDEEGRLLYASNASSDEKYCDMCDALRFYSDPDPYDWFRDDDQKAYCERCHTVIKGSLEWNELTRILRPKFCPKNN